MKILVINCGSSTIKYQLIESESEKALAKGKVERIGMDGAVLTHKAYEKDEVKISADILDHNAGIEYIVPIGRHLLALRAGGYNEPDHIIRFTGATGDPRFDIAEREIFPGGNDQLHITGGVGLVIDERFQVDAAANIAKQTTQLSLSIVYRF